MKGKTYKYIATKTNIQNDFLKFGCLYKTKIDFFKEDKKHTLSLENEENRYFYLDKDEIIMYLGSYLLEYCVPYKGDWGVYSEYKQFQFLYRNHFIYLDDLDEYSRDENYYKLQLTDAEIFLERIES